MTDALFDSLSALPSTAEAAKEAGSLYFFSGLPCANGHTDKRLASNNYCKSCQRANYLKHRPAEPPPLAPPVAAQRAVSNAEAKAARARAMAKGKQFFIGVLCRGCGGNKRYTAHNKCVHCFQAVRQKIGAKQRARNSEPAAA